MNTKAQAQYLRVEKAVIGERLRMARERSGVSIVDAATTVGVQTTAIEAWERGRTLPCLVQLKDLLAEYGVSPYPVLFGHHPVELTDAEQAELRRASRALSSSLERKLDLLLALLAKGHFGAMSVLPAGSEPR